MHSSKDTLFRLNLQYKLHVAHNCAEIEETTMFDNEASSRCPYHQSVWSAKPTTPLFRIPSTAAPTTTECISPWIPRRSSTTGLASPGYLPSPGPNRADIAAQLGPQVPNEFLQQLRDVVNQAPGLENAYANYVAAANSISFKPLLLSHPQILLSPPPQILSSHRPQSTRSQHKAFENVDVLDATSTMERDRQELQECFKCPQCGEPRKT